MNAFEYSGLPSRVVFGVGSLQHLGREIERLGARRALVLSTPEQEPLASRVAGLLGERAAGVFPKAVMHVPIEAARAAREEARRLGADCALAVGGGSTTGLGKAIALDSGLPVVAVPTTYAGSEMTPIYGLTEGGEKKTGRDPRVLPKAVVYDPELTVSLPLALSVTSGLNAVAHAAEGLYAHDGNPIMSLMAEEGIRAIASALPRLARDPADIEARSDALYGAWLCGSVLGGTSMGLHHKLCHTLGGSFDLPHAEVHTVVLPHALAYNAPAAGEAMARIARALGAARTLESASIDRAQGASMDARQGSSDHDAPRSLYDLAKRLGAPTSLAAIGMPADGLDRAADLAMRNEYPNPRPLDPAAIRALLQRAYDGEPPAS